MEKINKKIILALILLLAVISISAVSAIWPFDSGSDVTVNGVKFHLPEGFDTNNPVKTESDTTYGHNIYKNTETRDTVDIVVSNKELEDSVIKNGLIKKGFEQKNIAGKDGLYKFYVDKKIEFVYIDNDKVVSIIVPFIYDEHGDNFMKYDKLLEEIIK